MLVPTRPKWCPAGTLLTERGWVSPTGELLACLKVSKDVVAEWKKQHGLQRKSAGEVRPEDFLEEERQAGLEKRREELAKREYERARKAEYRKRTAKKATKKATKKVAKKATKKAVQEETS